MRGCRYHHIHHLNRKIPLYNLRKCHESAPPGTWDHLPILTWKSTLQSMLTTIYDYNNCCFRSFPELEWLMPDIKPFPSSPQTKSDGLAQADVTAKEE